VVREERRTKRRLVMRERRVCGEKEGGYGGGYSNCRIYFVVAAAANSPKRWPLGVATQGAKQFFFFFWHLVVAGPPQGHIINKTKILLLYYFSFYLF
jgi:hypothetical protein